LRRVHNLPMKLGVQFFPRDLVPFVKCHDVYEDYATTRDVVDDGRASRAGGHGLEAAGRMEG
jgi:hypothetical protein